MYPETQTTQANHPEGAVAAREAAIREFTKALTGADLLQVGERVRLSSPRLGYDIAAGTLGTVTAIHPTTYSVRWDGLDHGRGVSHDAVEGLAPKGNSLASTPAPAFDTVPALTTDDAGTAELEAMRRHCANSPCLATGGGRVLAKACRRCPAFALWCYPAHPHGETSVALAAQMAS